MVLYVIARGKVFNSHSNAFLLMAKIKYGSQTEYGKLKKVLMHRPTEENRRVTPSNKDAYLFRDVIYWKEFQREHDAFTDTLHGEGIEVLMLTDHLDPHHAEIANTLPNMVYTRDNLLVTSIGAHTLKMASAARHVEPIIMEKAIEKLKIPIAQRIEHPGTVEGGDFVWLNEDTPMMGFITRSNESGVKEVKNKLLAEKAVKEFVAVPLPSFRVHLDGVLMVLSPDIALFHEGSLGLFPCYVYNEDGVRLQYLRDYLIEKGVELIECNDTEVRMFGTNLLGIGDHKLISYEWNERLMELLDDRGFDVIGISGSQLSIGGGGPHCMTCPILREN
jgi:arginine deiminase